MGTKKDDHKDIEKIALKMSIASLMFGIFIGLISGLGIVISSLDGQVCGDVCMDSDYFYRMFEKWKESEIMMLQCTRGIEWIDDEFNLSLLIGQDEMNNFYDKYYDKFWKIREEQEEYFEIIEGAYVK